MSNPYTLNAGARPDVLVGRDDQLESFDILLKRLARGRAEQSMIITGLRGVGKTVLLGQFREKALAARWTVVEHEVAKHDEEAFRQATSLKLRAALLHLAPQARAADAHHLFLVVPMANWKESGAARERPFYRVSGRIAAFFGELRREVDVLSAHVFRYGSETPVDVRPATSVV